MVDDDDKPPTSSSVPLPGTGGGPNGDHKGTNGGSENGKRSPGAPAPPGAERRDSTNNGRPHSNLSSSSRSTPSLKQPKDGANGSDKPGTPGSSKPSTPNGQPGAGPNGKPPTPGMPPMGPAGFGAPGMIRPPGDLPAGYPYQNGAPPMPGIPGMPPRPMMVRSILNHIEHMLQILIFSSYFPLSAGRT